MDKRVFFWGGGISADRTRGKKRGETRLIFYTSDLFITWGERQKKSEFCCLVSSISLNLVCYWWKRLLWQTAVGAGYYNKVIKHIKYIYDSKTYLVREGTMQ